MASSTQKFNRPTVKVFVATTVLLSFISFWRAAAIVLSDLGSSAYYVGGDAEKVIGKSAPWFILAVMLFANCVRALYVESTSMFVRGGVYRVVRRAMGGTLAKFSVSALLFDYVLTGPLSSVVAGQYLIGFLHDIGQYLHHHFRAAHALAGERMGRDGCGYFLLQWHVHVVGFPQGAAVATAVGSRLEKLPPSIAEGGPRRGNACLREKHPS